jgi:pentatricopeptide repeat protein
MSPKVPCLQGVCSGVPPSAVSYAIMIKAFGNAGKPARASSLLHAMQASNTPIDSVCWNTAITACKSSRPPACDDAYDLLRLAEKAHAADVVTYNAVLAVLQSAGRADDARGLLTELLERGGSVQPNDVRPLWTA